MKTLLCLFFLLLSYLPSSAVSEQSDTARILSVISGSDSLANALPQKVDLKPYCPEVRHQGDLFSCVGWAIGYGALTIERAIARNCTDTKVVTHNASSALFIFNQIRPPQPTIFPTLVGMGTSIVGTGSRLTDAIAFLETNGDCLARHFDGDVNDAEKLPSEALSEAACTFSIAGATVLFEANEAAAIKVLRVKEALASKKPVTVGMAIRRNFFQLENALYWWPDLGDVTPAGGHALVVVGYDERKKAFQLMNSWGKNWGKGGFIWIKYEAFGRFCKYACVLHLN